MKNSTIMTWVLAVACEALLIAGFLLFGSQLPTNVLVLDIICASIALQGAILGFASPLVDRSNPAQPQIGSMGISLTGLNLYLVLCLGTIVVGIVNPLSFKVQAILQCAWLVLALLFFVFSAKAKEQTEEVYVAEKQKRDGVQQMRSAMRRTTDAACSPGVPADVKSSIDSLAEELRFVSPCDSVEASDYEDIFCSTMDRLTRALNSSYEMNADNIAADIEKARRALANRKNAYSR